MDPEVLASQLGQLGKHLDDATMKLAELDVLATAKGIEAARAKEEYEDALAAAFLASDGTVETRKHVARLNCREARETAHGRSASWELAKADVRNQQAMIRALERRIDIGRSLLSQAKTQMAILG